MSDDSAKATNTELSLKRALFAIKDLRARLEVLEKAQQEPLAIIGMSCRFPGGTDTPDAFWELMRDGRDAIVEIPEERWDANAFYDPDPDKPGKMNTKHGGFLNHVDLFDASFFEISPREAVSLDPQHRLLLEVCWEALENACQPWDMLSESKTGVFLGLGTNDYARLQQSYQDLLSIHAYSNTGNAQSTAAGRISYILGLQGPSMVIDTACSSSLVAIHLACQSLRLRECDRAMAGGVNLALTPDVSVGLSKIGMLSPDGRCKTFDARADGFGRGEGCGSVVLKRLRDALEAGDPILAIIRGSAVNQDGRSNGLTAPNGRAQTAVVRAALTAAGIRPEQIDYIEAHGTGTALGDPIEMQALKTALAENLSERRTFLVGSVKTNIGHLEAAAGIAGLIKTVLALQHEAIPPHLHWEKPNPYISWDQIPVHIPTTLTPWPVSPDKRRYAGISSFGASGTNAHIVLEEAPASSISIEAASTAGQSYVLPLSARSSKALHAQAQQYHTWLQTHTTIPVRDICYTASLRRGHHEYRLTAVGSTHEELANQLNAFLPGKSQRIGHYEPGLPRRKIAFVFSGQGGQYAGMGRELFEHEPVFRTSIETCEKLLRAYVSWSLVDELFAEKETTRLHQTQIAQPVLFALQISLAKLWLSWGIQPDTVTGHSVGEEAAAYISGALRLEDALRLVVLRGQIMQAAEGQGDMAVIELSAAEIKPLLQAFAERIAIAGYNSPNTTIVAGERAALETLLQQLQEKNGVFCRLLDIDYAFHCSQMDDLQQPFEERLRAMPGIHPGKTAIPFYSTVTGLHTAGEMLDASYWRRNIREPVQFAGAIQQLIEQGIKTFVEVGPQPVLRYALLQSLQHTEEQNSAHNDPVVVGSLRRQKSERATMLQALGELYMHGCPIQWATLYPGGAHCATLPTYPFQRTRFWPEETQRVQHWTSTDEKQESSSTQSEEASKQFRYEVQWISYSSDAQKSNLLTQGASTHTQEQHMPSPGQWLIFADRGEVGKELAEQLSQQGERCVLVYTGTAYARKDEQIYEVRPCQNEDLQQLFSDALTVHKAPWRGIVYLWSLDLAKLTCQASRLSLSAEIKQADFEPDMLQKAQELTCGSIANILQALVQHKGGKDSQPYIWLITSNAHTIIAEESHATGLLQAPLWGLGRVLAEEHHELWGGLVDLDATAPAATSAHELCTLLLSPDPSEKEFAFHRGQCYNPRLVRAHATDFRELSWHVDGAYLLTGGLGALGCEVARWMVSQGAHHLIMLNRTALPPRRRWRNLSETDPHYRQITAIQQLEALGVSILTAAVDVADHAQLESFLQAYTEECRPPIRGVMHLAGVLEESLLMKLDQRSLDAVWKPKVVGSWQLHALLRDQPLDFFVLFSALGALIGSPGLGSYAAANSFLDGLAHFRQAQGLPGVSINWGPWENLGFATTTGAQRMTNHFQKRGLKPLSIQQSLLVLDSALKQRVAQVAVASADWKLFLSRQAQEQRPPLLSLLAEEASQNHTDDPELAQRDTQKARRELEAIQPEQRHRYLEEIVREVVGQVLHLDKDQMSSQQSLGTLGVDSIMGLEIKNHLQWRLGLVLSSTIVWNYPTVSALTTHLTNKLSSSLETVTTLAPIESSREEVNFTAVEQLSEDEATSLLARTLAKIEENMRNE